MKTPHVHLAYAPRGVGLAHAVVYVEKDPDICGWWIGAIGADLVSAYFRLESFYARTGTALYTTDGSDLYGGWRFNLTSAQAQPIDHMAVEPDLAHELEQVQDAFAAEWLVFETDRDADREAQAYRDAELAHGRVNIRFAKLNKLDKKDPLWRYFSRNFESAVAGYLARRWPLDYGKN
jgi:hypothetical protein